MRLVIRWMIRALALIALGLSVYLSSMTLSGADSIAGCDGTDAGCDEVLGSTWSQWMGYPVSLFGSAVYGGIFIGTFLAPRHRWPKVRLVGRWMLLSLVPLAAAAGIWFLAVQWRLIGAYCPYCMAVHACGFAIFLLVIVVFLVDLADIRRNIYRSDLPTELASPAGGSPWPMGLGLLAMVALVVGQVVAAPDTYRVESLQAATGDPIDIDEPEPPAESSLFDDLTRSSNASAPKAMRVAKPELPPVPTPPLREPQSAIAAATPARRAVSGTYRPPANKPQGGEQSYKPGMTAWGTLIGDGRPAPETVTMPTGTKRRTLLLLRGTARLNAYKHPVYGDPDAEHLIGFMFDYTCPHCHAMWASIVAARERIGPSLSVVLIPVPLSAACNQAMKGSEWRHEHACHYAQLALGVWNHDPEQFREFHKWVMTPYRAPELDIAVHRAMDMVDREALRTSILSSAVQKRMKNNVFLYGRASGGSLPKIFIGDELITGRVNQPEELAALLRKHLQIAPR